MTSSATRSTTKTTTRATATWLVVVCLAIAAYSVANFVTGRWSVGVRDADRTSVYLLIALVVVLELAFILVSKPIGVPSGVVRALSALLAWAAIINLYRQTNLWLTTIQLTLMLWWIITYVYFSRVAVVEPDRHHWVPSIMRAFFVAYILAVLVSQREIAASVGAVTAVTNVIYFAVALAPFVLMYERPWLRFALISAWIFIALLSFKRGAIIATAAMLVVWLVVDAYCRGVRTGRLIALIFAPFILLITLIGANSLSSGFLFNRFGLDQLVDGSGRREIYAVVWADFSSGSIFQWLTGQGSGRTLELVGTGAHNDVLEVLVSFGIIGLLLQVGVILALLVQAVRLIRVRDSLAPAAAASVAGVISSMAVSGFLFIQSSVFTFVLFGYLHGRSAKKAQEAERAEQSPADGAKGTPTNPTGRTRRTSPNRRRGTATASRPKAGTLAFGSSQTPGR